MLQLIKAPPSKAKLSDHSVTHPTPSIQTKNREQLESYATDELRASQSRACWGEACQLTAVKDAQCLEINNTARSPAAPQQTAAASTMLTLSLARAIAWKRGGDEDAMKVVQGLFTEIPVLFLPVEPVFQILLHRMKINTQLESLFQGIWSERGLLLAELLQEMKEDARSHL